MARVLIVGGGARALSLTERLCADAHAVRITTREEKRRAQIEAAGAECWIGTPDRLATLKAALERITLVCWLLSGASGPPDELRALHSSRLEYFLNQIIDTPIRGFVYEVGPSSLPSPSAADGTAIARRVSELNAIPLQLIHADPADERAWIDEAHAAISVLLGMSADGKEENRLSR